MNGDGRKEYQGGRDTRIGWYHGHTDLCEW